MKKGFTGIFPIPHFVHWIMSTVLLVGTATLAPTIPHSSSTAGKLSVLALQQLVDTLLVADGDTGTDGSANVLALQRALLDTVQTDELPEDSPTAPRDAGVLPVPSRFLLSAPYSLPPIVDLVSAHQTSVVTPPPTGHLPPTAGTRMRYQFHLLSNAPPAARASSMNRFENTL